MRRILLKLTKDDDVSAIKYGDGVWHIKNKRSDVAVVRKPRLCRSIVDGPYVSDNHGILGRNKILSRNQYRLTGERETKRRQ